MRQKGSIPMWWKQHVWLTTWDTVPFGHIAEEELNILSQDIGVFEGNAQSFRVLTKLDLAGAESVAGQSLL